MNIKGAIFDLDGTLLDSMHIWDTLGEKYLLNRGIVPENGLNEVFKTLSLMQAAEYYRANYEIPDSVDEIIRQVNSMLDSFYAKEVKEKEGVISLLEEFHKNGVRMCIATATDKNPVTAALKNIGIEKYFSHIFTCGEVGCGKDCPDIFEKALDAIGTSKEGTLVFEDALYAIETAKKAGFKVVGVYDKSSEDEQEKIKEAADIYLSSYKDWSEIIE